MKERENMGEYEKHKWEEKKIRQNVERKLKMGSIMNAWKATEMMEKIVIDDKNLALWKSKYTKKITFQILSCPKY